MVEPLISPFPKRIKKAGLCYSELVTLKKLWESANKTQKKAILQNVITIKKYSQKVPYEERVSFLAPKSRNSQIKRRDLHIKTAFP